MGGFNNIEYILNVYYVYNVYLQTDILLWTKSTNRPEDYN